MLHRHVISAWTSSYAEERIGLALLTVGRFEGAVLSSVHISSWLALVFE